MKVIISTESTCDLPQELIEKNNISVIPYSIILGDDIITDDSNVPAKIFKYVEQTKTLPKTSAINEQTYTEYFENLLKDYDAVVHISLSSALSCSQNNAQAAAKNLENVYIIDSKSLSTGIGLLVLYAKELANNGETPESIVHKVKDRVPHVQASFVVDRLDYLYKGGRCNALALFGANLLKIHPQIVLNDGAMKPSKKYRGKMEKVIEKYCEDTIEEFNTPDKKVAFVTYTTATPEMIEIAKKSLQNAGFENIYESTAGGTITSHCGENVLGILYINDGNN